MKQYMVMILVMIFNTMLFSQAMYVHEGNAYGFSGSYESEEVDGGKTNTISLVGSYLLNGSMELGVGYNMGSYKDDTESDLDMTVNGFGFGGYYHIRNESLPFTVKIGGDYQTFTYENDILDEWGITMTGSGSGFGGGIYKTVSETDSYSLTPFIDFSKISYEIKMKDSSDSETTDDDFESFSFGVSIKMNNNYWIQPTIGQVDGESSFSIVVGTYFLQK